MINLLVESPSGHLDAYKYFWSKAVRGFDPIQHCARCLVGPYIRTVGKGMSLGKWICLPHDAPFFYLCGVTPRWETNLHLALRPKAGGVVSDFAYAGLSIQVEGAEKVDIPALPDGYAGRSKAFTTCRNWQFGVSQFGIPER